ncbi:hypothetical protein ACSD7O_00580 [Methylorubrum extorquens]|uniref:hypothetical protein n=1 Tax=Methylorubrum extorquens TaxID=408 RepID=UPI003F6441BD
MNRILAALSLAGVCLAPVAASAQYYEYGPPRRHHRHEHIEVERHGDHDHVRVRRHHGDHDHVEERVIERRHHHHHDFDD